MAPLGCVQDVSRAGQRPGGLGRSRALPEGEPRDMPRGWVCSSSAWGRGFLTSSVRKLMWLCHSHIGAQRDPGPPLHPHCWAPSPDPLQTSHGQLLPLPPKYLALSIAGLHALSSVWHSFSPESPSLSSLWSQLEGPWPWQAPRPRQWVRSCCHRLLHCLTFPLFYLIWRGRLESGY